MPRAGSTLQYNVLRLILERSSAGTTEGFAAADASRTSYVAMEHLLEWANDAPYHLVKTHTVHPDLDSLLAQGNTKVSYIFRDLRDVAVSRRIAWGDGGERLLEQLDVSVRWYWMLREFRIHYPASFLWQPYRDVVEDLPGAVREAASFMDVVLADGVLAEIAASCSVESVKPRVDEHRAELQKFVQVLRERDPKLVGPFLRGLGRGSERPEMFFREEGTELAYNQISPFKGAAGTWRTHLDEATSQTILERYSDWFEDALGVSSA